MRKKAKINITIDKDIYDKITPEAKKQGRNNSSFINWVLMLYFDTVDKPEKGKA